MILWNDEFLAQKIAVSVFPGIQGSVLMHAVAGKAVCLGEALKPEFVHYNRSVLENAKILASKLNEAGFRIVSGHTDTGLMLVDLSPKGLTGAEAAASLEKAGLACNKNLIPFDPLPAETASGIRLSSNAGTARGFGTKEFAQIAEWIVEILEGLALAGDNNIALERRVRRQVKELCSAFPIYQGI